MCTPHGKFLGIHEVEDPAGRYVAESIPIRCNKWSCAVCGPFKFKRLYARALNGPIAQPVDGFRPEYTHKLLTLTCPGEAYRAVNSPETALEDMNYKWNKLVRALQKRLGKFKYLKVVEEQRDGYPHFHIILCGGVIAPKDILGNIRHLWTELYGMGNVDIQKKKSSSPKDMVKYALKYIAKNPPELPKGKRLYSSSRGALCPVVKHNKKWILSRILSDSWCTCMPLQALASETVPELYELLHFADTDLKPLLLNHWRDSTRSGPGDRARGKREVYGDALDRVRRELREARQ